MFVDGLRDLCAKGLSSKGGKGIHGKSDHSTLVIVFMAFLCAVLPLDISQLSFAMVGAILYALLQKSDQVAPKQQRISVVVEAAPPQKVAVRASNPRAFPGHPASLSGTRPKPALAPSVVPEVRAPSAQPILAPTFQSKGWEGEIQELLQQITPTAEGDEIVKQLTRIVQQSLKTCIPNAEVSGFANGRFATGKAFGVAVPEVDIVVRVSPQILFARLQRHNGQGSASEVDAKKLQKCALRTFTDRLVSAGGFKFRRSAFRGQEPKVTLLAPASLGLFSESIPIDFSVNVMTPLYNAALLAECGRMDCRAKELILIVKRWAKDRGICHAAKGHLPPYLWGLLTIYFLQVRSTDDESPLLPPLEQFEMSSTLQAKDRSTTGTSKHPMWKPAEKTNPQTSVGSLFKDFIHFFESTFDWRNEAVSIRAGRRAPPSFELPLHIIVSDDSTKSQVGPSIEDPFHAAQNLGDGMNVMSFARLKEELLRAKVLCDSDSSLSVLLEPWVPADFETGEPQHDDEHTNGSEGCVGAQKGRVWRAQVVALKGKGSEDPPVLALNGKGVVHKRLPDAAAMGCDWRRDASEAQASVASRSNMTPPWRRPGAVC